MAAAEQGIWLCRFAQPLYSGVPVEAAEALPGLLNAIKIIYDISRYYNCPVTILRLLVKVNRQMVLCCRRFLSPPAGMSLWELEPAEMHSKILQCERFNLLWKHQYRHLKQTLQDEALHGDSTRLPPKQLDFDEDQVTTQLHRHSSAAPTQSVHELRLHGSAAAFSAAAFFLAASSAATSSTAAFAAATAA